MIFIDFSYSKQKLHTSYKLNLIFAYVFFVSNKDFHNTLSIYNLKILEYDTSLLSTQAF